MRRIVVSKPVMWFAIGAVAAFVSGIVLAVAGMPPVFGQADMADARMLDPRPLPPRWSDAPLRTAAVSIAAQPVIGLETGGVAVGGGPLSPAAPSRSPSAVARSTP